jgi:Fe2+ transport system protein FeoA
MSSISLAFSSSGDAERIAVHGNARKAAAHRMRALSSLPEGAHGTIAEVRADRPGQADRLIALGVTAGARITVLQRFPGIVFLCDQTELAVERSVADSVFVIPEETRS